MNLKQRNITLVIGIVLLFWIAYLFSFAKTFELKKYYTSLKNKQQLFTNVSQKIHQLKQQNVYYDSILKSKKIVSESSFQNNLLQTIASFADSTHTKIVTFNTPHLFKTNTTIVNTFSFTLCGNFSKITQLIYLLEQQQRLGKIISIHYNKKKNYRRNFSYLECTILLQQVEQI